MLCIHFNLFSFSLLSFRLFLKFIFVPESLADHFIKMIFVLSLLEIPLVLPSYRRRFVALIRYEMVEILGRKK